MFRGRLIKWKSQGLEINERNLFQAKRREDSGLESLYLDFDRGNRAIKRRFRSREKEGLGVLRMDAQLGSIIRIHQKFNRRGNSLSDSRSQIFGKRKVPSNGSHIGWLNQRLL